MSESSPKGLILIIIFTVQLCLNKAHISKIIVRILLLLFLSRNKYHLASTLEKFWRLQGNSDITFKFSSKNYIIESIIFPDNL